MKILRHAIIEIDGSEFLVNDDANMEKFPNLLEALSYCSKRNLVYTFSYKSFFVNIGKSFNLLFQLLLHKEK